jgi:hypothetical protein
MPKADVWGDPGAAIIDFSPDGRFVIAAPDGTKAEGSPVVFDLREKQRVKLKGDIKNASHRVFAFIASDRVLMAELDIVDTTVRATLVSFPSGKVLSKPKIPAGGLLFRATDPGFVLIHPFGLHAYYDPQAKRTAAAELKTGKVIVSETPALDVFGNYYVAQLANGELGLYDRSKGLQATIKLPGR